MKYFLIFTFGKIQTLRIYFEFIITLRILRKCIVNYQIITSTVLTITLLYRANGLTHTITKRQIQTKCKATVPCPLKNVVCVRQDDGQVKKYANPCLLSFFQCKMGKCE